MRSPSPSRRVAPVLILCVVVFLLHANALDGFFLGDDFDILRQTQEHHGLKDAFLMTFVGNWGPMSYVQFYLDYLIGGLNPWVYHLNNLLWLCLAVVGLYALVRTAWPESRLAAWSAALLFATHPVNDQAIDYICARSHSIAAALAVVALALYARFRLEPGPHPRRAALLAGALAVAFLAGLSKESALTLPAWIAAFEWLFARRDDEPFRRSILRALGSAVLFALPAVAVFVARRLAIGGQPRKLEQASGEISHFWSQLGSDLPVYGLVGGLPFPFGWIDHDVLQRFLLGWVVVAAGVAAGAVCFYRSATRRAVSTRAAALYVLGLTITTVTLLPTVYAELQIQRRYFFITNVGFALMAAATLGQMNRRSPRRIRLLLALLVLAGAAATLQRNDLYRRSGIVMQRLVENLRGAPLGAPVHDADRRRRIVLTTLPRYLGGDKVSGAILMNRTDLNSALRLFGVSRPTVHYALVCHHAEDYSAEARFMGDTDLLLTVSFRTRRALEAALTRDPQDDGWGGSASAELISTDRPARKLTYRVHLAEDFWGDGDRQLFLYTDERLSQLSP